jgi:hypothetical protein
MLRIVQCNALQRQRLQTLLMPAAYLHYKDPSEGKEVDGNSSFYGSI